VEPWSREMAGRFDALEIESSALRDNPLGDPHVRPLWVYVPPAYDAEPDRRFPSIYLIQGMTGQVDMWWNRTAFRPTTPERIDRLFAEEDCPPALVVLADCWTSYGGAQFIDSPGTGRYCEYLCDEVVSFVDARYRTLAEPAHRGLTGTSSGGYGAMVVPMLRPDVFGGLATHAGDALFEHCYLREFPDTLRALRNEYEGSYDTFWEEFRSRPGFTKQSDYPLVNTYAMAACYSANEDGSVDLPFDLDSGLLRDDVWQRWLAWDPVRMAPRHADALRSMRAIYIDAGTRDEYFLDLGAEAFRRELAELGITDVFFELFDAGHGAIEYRYPLAIRYLAERLQ
jgi:S-formylglutathione hydrolase FrmB